ncbi:hypothetical protein CFP56_029180 [Quercus suber]|uniref:Leucine-rich repeat-containing N-terminal plant-type domain-containing protein n=1 Tax=Quercus suber TaxID=58331 RepID=A0AAW0MD17_QUESU
MGPTHAMNFVRSSVHIITEKLGQQSILKAYNGITLFSWLFLIPICSLFMSFCIFVVSGQCLGNQRSCLIELKDNLKFNSISSTELVRWNESFDCCLQKGLGCSDEHVIGHKLTKESIMWT